MTEFLFDTCVHHFSQVEQGKEWVQQLEKKLHTKNSKLRELQELTDLFPYRVETEDKLRTEISTLQNQLANAKHDLAVLKSHHDSNKMKELGERVDQLQSELQQRTQTCATLQEQLNQALASLKAARQEGVRSKAAEEQPREQLARLQEILKQKESTLQGVLAEKEKVEEHCHSLQSQTAVLKSEMEDLHEEMIKSVSHASNICSLREEKEKEVETLTKENVTLISQLSDVQTDSKKFLQAYEKAVIQVQEVQEEKEAMAANLKQTKKDLEEAVVLKAELDSQIASMSSEMAEKEEYRELQVCNLQSSLEKAQEQLREKDVELEQVKTQLQQRRGSEEGSSEGEDEKEVKKTEGSLMKQDPTAAIKQHHVSGCLSLAYKEMCSCYIVLYPHISIQATGGSVDDEVQKSLPSSPQQLRDHYHRELQHLQEKLKVRAHLFFISTIALCNRSLFLTVSHPSWSTWERLLCCGYSMMMR